ncbi:hypothetical protein SS50377_24478 [Spironucleus salmonicida]|uniref:Uncharacterized protein n=1 Tax=Spironucleus salmonicida TaxID=348837 RepID=A0A9P8RZ53_9EUKA|nr:hypothetical protein SS50377_24478 [Spironucleus salmonicida]
MGACQNTIHIKPCPLNVCGEILNTVCKRKLHYEFEDDFQYQVAVEISTGSKIHTITESEETELFYIVSCMNDSFSKSLQGILSKSD